MAAVKCRALFSVTRQLSAGRWPPAVLDDAVSPAFNESTERSIPMPTILRQDRRHEARGSRQGEGPETRIDVVAGGWSMPRRRATFLTALFRRQRGQSHFRRPRLRRGARENWDSPRSPDCRSQKGQSQQGSDSPALRSGRDRQTYQQHGASCISVLTDEQYFQGSLEYLRQVRAAVALPVLRKDFIIDPYQVVEARAAGADAVLLIAECLDDDMLGRFTTPSSSLEMTPLVELYEPANLARVLRIGARLVGVNNRDLRTSRSTWSIRLRLRRQIPDDRIVVGESGIRTRQDVQRLQAAGVHAMLVGESLLRQPDVGAAVDELLGTVR